MPCTPTPFPHYGFLPPALHLLWSHIPDLLALGFGQRDQRLNPLRQDLGVRAENLGVFTRQLTVGEEEECRHRCHAVLLGNLCEVVDVDLGKGQLAVRGVLGRELLVERSDGLAGAAPRGSEVGNDILGGLEEVLELSLRLDVHCSHFGR